MKPRCGKWMPIAKEGCAKGEGHKGKCETAASQARQDAGKREWHAANPNFRQEWRETNPDYGREYNRERYAGDPQIRARILLQNELNKIKRRLGEESCLTTT